MLCLKIMKEKERKREGRGEEKKKKKELVCLFFANMLGQEPITGSWLGIYDICTCWILETDTKTKPGSFRKYFKQCLITKGFECDPAIDWCRLASVFHWNLRDKCRSLLCRGRGGGCCGSVSSDYNLAFYNFLARQSSSSFCNGTFEFPSVCVALLKWLPESVAWVKIEQLLWVLLTEQFLH